MAARSPPDELPGVLPPPPPAYDFSPQEFEQKTSTALEESLRLEVSRQKQPAVNAEADEFEEWDDAKFEAAAAAYQARLARRRGDDGQPVAGTSSSASAPAQTHAGSSAGRWAAPSGPPPPASRPNISQPFYPPEKAAGPVASTNPGGYNPVAAGPPPSLNPVVGESSSSGVSRIDTTNVQRQDSFERRAWDTPRSSEDGHAREAPPPFAPIADSPMATTPQLSRTPVPVAPISEPPPPAFTPVASHSPSPRLQQPPLSESAFSRVPSPPAGPRTRTSPPPVLPHSNRHTVIPPRSTPLVTNLTPQRHSALPSAGSSPMTEQPPPSFRPSPYSQPVIEKKHPFLQLQEKDGTQYTNNSTAPPSQSTIMSTTISGQFDLNAAYGRKMPGVPRGDAVPTNGTASFYNSSVSATLAKQQRPLPRQPDFGGMRAREATLPPSHDQGWQDPNMGSYGVPPVPSYGNSSPPGFNQPYGVPQQQPNPIPPNFYNNGGIPPPPPPNAYPSYNPYQPNNAVPLPPPPPPPAQYNAAFVPQAATPSSWATPQPNANGWRPY